MRPFAAVERFFERLFERPSARLFHSPLQSVQIQRRLEQALDTGRVFSGDLAYVPNRFTVRLHPDDAEEFDDLRETLEDELAEAVHARARARGYRLLARPTVTLAVSDKVRRGDIEVDAEAINRNRVRQITEQDDLLPAPTVTGRFIRPAPAPVPAAAALVARDPVPAAAELVAPAPLDAALPALVSINRPSAPAAQLPNSPPAGSYVPLATPERGPLAPAASSPSVLQTPEPALQPEPLAVVEVRTNGRVVAARPFTGTTLRIGRARDNDLVLVDDRVSRHHGQLSSRTGVVVYTDLRSTNGSFLNGSRVREIVLGSGDVVRLGNSTLTIQQHT